MVGVGCLGSHLGCFVRDGSLECWNIPIFTPLRDPRAGVRGQQWEMRDLHLKNPKFLLFLRSQKKKKVGIFLKMWLERGNWIEILDFGDCFECSLC